MVKLVVFDFDGPIVDSFLVYYKLYNDFCKEYSVKAPWNGEESFKDWYDGDWKNNTQKLGLADKTRNLEDRFREYRDKHPAILQEGISDLIKELGQRVGTNGFHQVILSSNSSRYIGQFLGSYDLVSHFSGIFGFDSFNVSKPNPKTLEHVRKCFNNVSPLNTVYIGDTVSDMQFAQKDGSKTIAVTNGFNSRKVLEAVKPDFIVDNSYELRDALHKLI